jgi:hypothetical protein
VARALILHENDQDTAQFQKVLQWIRSDKELSKKVTVLDKDAKNPDESPNKTVQDALRLIGGNPLPRVLVVSSDGAFIKHVEFPKTEDDAAKLLKELGLQ